MTSVRRSLSPIRKIIAARMTEAKRSIPHFRLISDIEIDALLALRAEANAARGTDKLSVNDFLIKASALALIENPRVNVQWAETAIDEFSTADISVVVSIDGGLATPIVRRAEDKSVTEISQEMRVLAERAARGALKMDEVVGGTFSISNLGKFGVEQFDAIINPPQCAILAVGAARKRQVIDSEGSVRIAAVMRTTLSVDHRAIDGAVAARFLSSLRSHIEAPQTLVDPKECMQ